MPYWAVLAVNTTRVHLFALLFILLVVMLVAAFLVIAFVIVFRSRIRPSKTSRVTDRPVDSPELVLARRLPTGAIDGDEYRRRIEALYGREAPPPA